MSTIDQQARIELSLNAQKATDKLNELTKEAAKLNKELQATEKGTKQYEKLEKQLNAVEKNMRKAEKAAFDVNKVLDNLSGASINDINKAIREMTRQMNGMDRNSDSWKFYKEQIERAKEELKKINSEGKESESWLSRFNNKFAKWGSLVATAIAGFTGLTLTVQKFRQMAMEKESSQANLKALTGLDDQSIEWLTRQAEQLSTTMHESGFRVRQSSQEILDAYTLVGSAKPELLSNKEALNAVTIEAMRLAEASGMDLAPAVDAVTLSMNQFGASADQASRYTNVMAAGSKYGSAAVQSITTSLKNAGVAAYAANIPIEAVVGSIENLAEKGIKDEVAGTGLKTFFLKLEGMSEDVRPSVVGLQTALENLQAKQMDSVEMQKAFGLEAYTVAQAMIDGADKVKYYTEAVTGTNVAVEQAMINSDTAEAKRAQTINQIKEIGIELGQRLTPLLVSSAKASTVLMKVFLGLLEACEKYKITVIALVSAITAVTVAKNKDIIVSKLSILWNQKLIGSIKSLWTAMMSNPITALVAAFTVLIGVVADFARKTIETNKQIKALNNTVQDLNRSTLQGIQSEKAKLNDLLKIARDEWKSKKERAEALAEIIKMSPEYLGGLTLETVKTKEGAAAIKRYTDSLLALERQKEFTAKRDELRGELQQKLNEFYDSNKGQATAEKYGRATVEQLAAAGSTNSKSDKAQIGVYNEFYRENEALQALIRAYNNVDAAAQKYTATVMKNQAWVKENSKVQPQDALAIGGTVIPSAVTDSKDKTKEKTDVDVIKEQEKQIDKLAKSKLVIEQIAYLQGEKSLEEHMKVMHDIENSAITAKQMLYLDDQDKWNELELERLENTKDYEEKIKNIKIQKEQEAEQFKAKYIQLSAQEKMQNELDVLETMYQQELYTVEEYEKLKAAIQEKFTEETDKKKRRKAEEYKKWDELNIEEQLERIANYAEQAWSQISALMNAGSELMQANMDLEIAKINQRYDVQLQRAEGNEEETTKLEEKKEAEIARVKNEYNKRQMKMQMAQTLATSAIGILNAWVSAMALPAPASLIMGGILSGIMVAQTAMQIAALKKQQEAQAAGYYSGGYTSRTLRDTDPAGIVHGNEFVANARAVRNPAIRPMLDFIDTAQRNNYISSITSTDVARAAGAVPATTTVINNNTDSETLAQVVAVVAKLSKQLDQPIVAQTFVTGKGGSLEANKLYDKMISNATK